MKRLNDTLQLDGANVLFNTNKLIFGHVIDDEVQKIDNNFQVLNHIETMPEYEKVVFEKIPGFILYSKNSIFYQVLLQLPMPNDSSRFKGELVLNGVQITDHFCHETYKRFFLL